MGPRLKSIALFATLTVGLPAIAGSDESFDSPSRCSYIRLDQGIGPFANLPVYNQALGTEKDPDICYAVTAAQLIDAYRARQGDRRELLTSPVSVALYARIMDAHQPDKMRKLSYDDSDPLTFMVSGGSITAALRASRNKMVCDQRWLDGFAKLISDSDTAEPIDRFLLGLAGRSADPTVNINLVQNVAGGLSVMCMDHDLRTEFPLAEESNQPGGDYLEAQAGLVKKLQDPGLTNEQRMKLVEDFQNRFDPENKIQFFGQAISDLLERPRSTGVGIGYLYRAVGSRKSKGSIRAHASVIVGRRTNPDTRKCEFLVRDSYGPDCRNSEGKDRYDLPCENGSIWVEARSLLKDTMNLTWIPSAPPAIDKQ